MTGTQIPEDRALGPAPRRSSPDRPRRSLRRGLAAAALLAVLVGAWLLRPEGKEPAESGATPTPTSSVSPTPGATPTGEPVTGANAATVRDFTAIFEELEALRARAYHEYRPELLDEVYSPICNSSCNVEGEKRVINEMKAEGARFSNYEPRILLVQLIPGGSEVLVNGKSARTVGIRVVTEQSDYQILGRDGQVRQQLKGWSPRSEVFEVHFSSEKNKWLMWDLVREGSGERFLDPNHRLPTPTETK